MKNLLLTLGHNSSAILADGAGNVINGVEEERLSRIKSDSTFPYKAIDHVLKDLNGDTLKNIFISHWFDDFDFLQNAKNVSNYTKYCDIEFLTNILNKNPACKIVTLSQKFSHHDAHASSVMAFYENFSNDNSEYNVIVADGFGNQQEVFSLYEIKFKNGKKIIKQLKRVYGYEFSLGLLYQYATAYCGMKENKDEWKYLAYESHIKEEFDESSINAMNQYVAGLSNNFIKIITDNKKTIPAQNIFINLNALETTRQSIYGILDKLIKNDLNIKDNTSYSARIAVGFVVQSVLENVITKVIKCFNIKNLLVAGGIFYNVKLNNKCLKEIEGNFSVVPLAGDQGAAIGLYYNKFKKFNFKDLCWGKRNLSIHETKLSRVKYCTSQNELVELATNLLQQDKIVQVVIGNEEFGPRALCHTSTLFLPQKYNADINDAQNDRLSLMPLAPVILAKNLGYFFDKNSYSRVIGSDRYMIITYDYIENILHKEYNGVMHKYPLLEQYSGRPQVIHDEHSTIYKILDTMDKKNNVKALVNTSFNVHSQPIVFSVTDALENFEFQQKNCPEEHKEKTYLLIGAYNE